MLNYIKIVFALIKYKVSMAVTFTAITGFIIYAGNIDFSIFQLAVSVFILAGGSSALNECQESKYDAKMERTRNRPIPSSKISHGNALVVSLLFIFTGIFLLYFFFGLIPFLLGLFNIFWYNLLYTNLKRITPFAVVPGSLVGAVPVLIGWTAAGGYAFDLTIVFVGFFLFVWQVPHFWLLMLKYGKEYEEAGFPTINRAVNPESLMNIIYAWIVATSFSSIAIPLFLEKISLIFFISIFVLNITFVIVFTQLSFGKVANLNFKKSFISINIYMFVFMILLIIFHLLPTT